MNHCYRDILDRIKEPPRWFDENAVPRYCAFAPDEVANIYACECVLFEIGCQSCRRGFRVAMSRARHGDPRSLTDSVRDKTLHYGDPPNVECCGSGLSMNSIPLRVLEFWQRGSGTSYNWVRVPDLEIDIHADWDDNPEPVWFVDDYTAPVAEDLRSGPPKVQRILDLDDD